MPDEHRRCGWGDFILQRKALVGGNILRTGQLHKAVPVGVFPGGDHRVGQQQGVGARLVCHARDIPHRTRQRQMPARRKAAQGNFIQQNIPLFCVLPHKADGLCQLPHGQRIPGALPYCVVQYRRVVASCRKLQRYGVALPGADVGIAAAGHHQHQRALPEMRHGLHALPQVERQRTAAGQFQLLKLHSSILLIKSVPSLRVRRNKFCA